MPQRQKAKTRATDAHSLWEALTWEDLNAWAGARSVQRGRTYQRQGRVDDLVLSEEGRLLASVSGNHVYVTSVWCTSESPREHPIQSTCTCPVGYDGCKHAVAVAAEYLQTLADGEEVPPADPDDPRWLELQGDGTALNEDLDEYGNPFLESKQVSAASNTSRRSREEWDRKIAEHIRAKGREELSELVISLTERFPELREEFQKRISLSEGDVDRLVKQARRQMEQQTSEPGWRNSWRGEGFTPDFSGFRHRLERLVELGHADAVVELGRDFIRLGMDQIAQSHDEGETGMAFAACLPVIFAAVTQSSLSGPEQLLFAVDAHLEDDYGFVDEATEPILDGDWTEADWSEVAELLQQRLAGRPDEEEADESSFSSRYDRDCLSGWLLRALENAGRTAELRQVYETEARTTGSYVRLVRYLIGEGEIDEACRWAHAGIERTHDSLRGVANQLAELLCGVARDRKQWDVVAAHAAADFFEHPGCTAYDELLKAARKAKCLNKVKAPALTFLETGKLPFARRPQGKGKNRTFRVEPLAEWPLPLPDCLAPLLPVDRKNQPRYSVLLDIAIAAKKPGDVLHWYEKLSAGARTFGGCGRGWVLDTTCDRVADAVVKSHPERALEIYADGLNADLGPADPQAYDRAASYLKKMRPVLKRLGRESEWTELMQRLRTEYKRRRLFMEALDRIEGRTIVEAQRK